MKGIECAFTGVLSKDPELKTLKAGKSFANPNIGVVTGQMDDGKDAMQWLRLVCFGEVAEKIAASAKKGSSIYAEGQLTATEYTDKAGEKKHGLDVRAFKVELLGASAIGRNKSPRSENKPSFASASEHREERTIRAERDDYRNRFDNIPYLDR
jgi:single stranded DNA-binding protein